MLLVQLVWVLVIRVATMEVSVDIQQRLKLLYWHHKASSIHTLKWYRPIGGMVLPSNERYQQHLHFLWTWWDWPNDARPYFRGSTSCRKQCGYFTNHDKKIYYHSQYQSSYEKWSITFQSWGQIDGRWCSYCNTSRMGTNTTGRNTSTCASEVPVIQTNTARDDDLTNKCMTHNGSDQNTDSNNTI